ncbi:porin [Prochlorococcus marinus]|uniref:porin n=1 Tax=Prochlorococcus marinus TaxID=1219 RepID=UPI001ADB49D0|nr:porin [Prochlorococcus marinus]MBO8217872.1 porin [Prochlorococcus marinus XMU1405]MBW3041025.1 porin [Prochlorococcus marinus str. MU1405]MBW3048485.1 porin [Prochlorococcus marinus str. MU1406]
MKLFQKIIIAPVVLGFLSPIAVQSSDIVNIEEINNYVRSQAKKSSRLDSETFIKEVSKDFANLKGSADGLEAQQNEYEAGAFSETTTMSGAASFQVGAVDGSVISEAVTATYSYDLDLNTTFTGDDNLYIGIETGNGGLPTIDFNLDSSGGGADILNVTSMYYQFPLGSYEVAVGPKLDSDDLMPTTLSKYSDKFFMAGSNGGITAADFYYAPGITGSGVAIARTFDNGFNTSASVIGMSAGNSDGLLTKEGGDTFTLSAGYDGENYGLGFIYNVLNDVCAPIADYETCASLGFAEIAASSTSIGGYWNFNEGKTTLSVSMGVLSGEVPGSIVEEINEAHFGIDHELGEGVLSAAIKSSDFYRTVGNTALADSLGEFAEIYYSYDLNDSMEITGGISFAMGDNTETTFIDRTAFGAGATFKF